MRETEGLRCGGMVGYTSFESLQDECLALVLHRVCAGTCNGTEPPLDMLSAWVSLLCASRRTRKLALSTEFAVWHTLTHTRFIALGARDLGGDRTTHEGDNRGETGAGATGGTVHANHASAIEDLQRIPASRSACVSALDLRGFASPADETAAQCVADTIANCFENLTTLCLQPLPEPDGLSSPCFGRHFAQVLPRLAHLTTVSFSRCDIADSDLIRSAVLHTPACIWRAIGRSQRVHARQDLQ